MNPKIIMVVLAVAILVTVGVFYGALPGLSILDKGTTTTNREIGGLKGSGELIGPNSRKGFIASYKNDGFSETVTCIGKVHIDTWATAAMKSCLYEVYGKKQGGSYEMLSSPTGTSMYISNPNPDFINLPDTISFGGTYNMDAYSFEFVGSDYDAVKVVLKGYIDGNILNPFDGNFKWQTLQTDEAYLYEGYGSLNLPTDSDGRPRDNFEIGETVDIRVETAKGGQTVEGTGTWRVTLNEPYSGGITQPGSGGGVVKEEYYNDDTIGHFKFVVTEDMAQKSMDSSDPYSVRIWNTILPMGTLYTDFIDFNVKGPGDVELSGPIQSKVGSSATVGFSASVNSDTQLPIDYFRVSVIYGTNNVLLPSDPNAHNWIIHTTNIPAVNNAGTISFTPSKESYVTTHVKAFDTEGRGSPRTRTWTLWAYADAEVPDDVVDDETGDDDYGGGHTDPWFPWDPSGGNWGNIRNYLPLIIAIAVFIIMLIIAFIPQIPIPFGMYGRMMVVVLGAVLAAVIYWYLGGTI